MESGYTGFQIDPNDGTSSIRQFLPDKEAVEIERRQAEEEGRDIGPLEKTFRSLAAVEEWTPTHVRRARRLFERVQERNLRKGFPYREPDRWKAIRELRPKEAPELPPPPADAAVVLDRLHGAWLGRCCGCLAGKPVEGRTRASMRRVLEAQGRWPLSDYWSMKVDPKTAREEGWFTHGDEDRPPPPHVKEGIRAMPEDDDLNFTVASFLLLRDRGPGFTSGHVAALWLERFPALRLYTAERAAYRNLLRGLPPPAAEGPPSFDPFTSATWCNPYREWIGARIRADFYGYAAPGRPEQAAEWAWRDACVSHVKNGIYGALWSAAMHAAAWCTDDLAAVLRAGLAQVPRESRLRAVLDDVLRAKADGRTWKEMLDSIHERWDEGDPHDWCHTLPNAAVTAAALLWGEGGFTETIGLAVTAGFDTDCNGGLVGSLLGLIRGAKAIPSHWTDPLRDILETGLAGIPALGIRALAEGTLALIRR